MRSVLCYAVLAIGFVLSACHESLPDDTVVIAAGSIPATFFPPTQTSTTGISIINQLFLRLADVGPELNTWDDDTFQPQIASAWEFEDSLTLVFHINPLARWHDGQPITATDVAFTFDVYRDPAVVGAAPLLSSIETVTARDSLTVVMSFNRHYPEQLYDGTFHTFILPSHLLQDLPRADLASSSFAHAPVGSGRYRYENSVPEAFAELRAVKDHWLGSARIPRQLWRGGSHVSTRSELLLVGEVDLVKSITPLEAILQVESSAVVETVPYPAGYYAFIAFNNRSRPGSETAEPFFADRDLRWGIVSAVDRAAVARSLLGDWGLVPPGPVSPMLPTWSTEVAQVNFDTAAADAALSRAGWVDTDHDGIRDRDGLPLEFELTYPTSSSGRRRAAVLIQEQLTRVGVRMEMRGLDRAAFGEARKRGDFDAIFGYWNQDPTPSSILETWTTRAIGGLNYQAYSNARFDSLAFAAAGRFDREESIALWHLSYEELNRDAAAIWVYSSRQVAGVSQRIVDLELRSDIWSANFYKMAIGDGEDGSGND